MRRFAAVVLMAIAINVTPFSLSSCVPQDRFRYECQDPANSEAPPCQTPACQASRTCPELLDPKDAQP